MNCEVESVDILERSKSFLTLKQQELCTTEHIPSALGYSGIASGTSSSDSSSETPIIMCLMPSGHKKYQR